MTRPAPLTVGSLFAGIGGLELGLEQTGGFKTIWSVEIDDFCNTVRKRHWPDVPQYGDIREFPPAGLERPDVICGGDPCPAHSRARSNGASKHPDLSGYFLSVVGRLLPQWVVRENVPASTVKWFDAALAALGYGTAIIRVDAVAFTGQSRVRDFIVGRYKTKRVELYRSMRSFVAYGPGPGPSSLGARQVAPALTCHRTRYDSRDCYIYRSGQLRILDGDERCRLAGFLDDWASGFSEATQARMFGNAVVPACSRWIGEKILDYDTSKIIPAINRYGGRSRAQPDAPIRQ